MSGENKFLKGAAILGVAGILVKLMGMLFRLPLTNWVGADGLSYYSSVYPIYTFFLLLSTAGIPVAISRMISERNAVKNYGGAHKVFRTSVWLLGTIGMISFIIVFFGAGFIERVVLDHPGTSYSLQAIAPSLFIVPVMAAYRGYFQGRQNMNPTALSQFFEQMTRVCVGLILAYQLIKTGNEAVSAGAIFGSSAGAFVGLLVAVLIYILNHKTVKKQMRIYKDYEHLESSWSLVKEILAISIPITIGACILPLVNAIDAMMVMRILQHTGWSFVESKALWGRLGGYCSSLIGMPQVLIQAIVMSLVPAIAAGYKLKNHKEVEDNMNFAMRTAMIVGFPCAVGMFVLAKPILLMLYPRQVQEANDAVPTLQLMTISIIFLSIMVTVTGELQGIDKQMLPVKNLAIGAIAKVIVTLGLTSIHAINVNGAPLGTLACYIVASVLDIRDLKKCTGIKFDPVMTYVRPGAASAGMGIVAFAAYKIVFLVLHSNALGALMGIILGVISYAILIFALKAISLDEVRKLPKGDKIAKLAGKFVRK